MDTEETLDDSTEEEMLDSPSVEVEEEEPSMEEVEEETSDEESEPSEDRLYANKYSNTDDLEEAYKHSDAENSRLAQDNARLRKENEQSNLTDEEKKYQEDSREFVKSNDLVTKQDLKDERDVIALLNKGVGQTKIDHVTSVARLSKYSSMSIPQIYREVYGSFPKVKPKQGARAKSTSRSTGNKTMTRTAFGKLKVGTPEYDSAESNLMSGKLSLVN